jgi:hypothetical protein
MNINSVGQEKEFLAILHNYQPVRTWQDVSTIGKGVLQTRADMVSWINEDIYNACYKPLLVETERLPMGALFSFYGSLRGWIEHNHPTEFDQIRENIANTPDREYSVLGDPWLHPILPLQSEANQDMMVKIGLQAIEEDLGFKPKGFWLPESAVNSTTLRVLKSNGIEFVVLRSDQIGSTQQNPMYVRLDYKDENGQQNKGEMAVFHYDMGLSGAVSFQPELLRNGDEFLKNLGDKSGRVFSIGSDAELYGWHQKFADKFFKHITNPETQRRHGFKPFSVKDHLLYDKHEYTFLKEDSSWSCEHNLGRWTGQCSCEGRTEEVRNDIQQLYSALVRTGDRLDAALDRHDRANNATIPWRQEFVKFFLATRNGMFFSGNLYDAIQKITPNKDEKIGRESRKIASLSDPTFRALMTAQLAEATARTSCFGFYGHKNAPERVLVSQNMKEIEKYLKGVDW